MLKPRIAMAAAGRLHRRRLRPTPRQAGGHGSPQCAPRLVPVEEMLPLILAADGAVCDDQAQRETESLPFVVRIARDRASLLNAVAARHDASTTLPAGLEQDPIEPESDDLRSDCIVWIAESKADGHALGTMRVQINRQRPLGVEQTIELPRRLRDQVLSDVRRMAVLRGAERMQVVLALLKANLLYLQARQVAWSIIVARPPMSEVYKRTMLYDVFEAATLAGGSAEVNAGCEVLAFEVATARARFAAARHPASRFLFDVDHPDICID